MDLRPIGAPLPGGSLGQVAPLALNTARAAPGTAAGIAAIVDIAALPELSPSDMVQLLGVLEPPALPADALSSQSLLAGAVSAAERGDSGRALEQLAELVRLDPGRIPAVRSEPGLEPMRSEVNELLIRLETLAGLDAQGRLASAAHVVESLRSRLPSGWDMPPEALLTIANRVYELGGYVNYIHAASFAQTVIEGASGVPVGSVSRRQAGWWLESTPRPRPGPWLKRLWNRAPLLILLVSWFVLGMAVAGGASILHYFRPEQFPTSIADIGFAVWGIGFPALVGVGFYMRVRHIRMR